MSDWLLRQQIIPILETAGLIVQVPDPNDKRKQLVYPAEEYARQDSEEKVKRQIEDQRNMEAMKRNWEQKKRTNK